MAPPAYIDCMLRRRSSRVYDGKGLRKRNLGRLQGFLSKNCLGPFGTTLRFKLVDISRREESIKLGTYGVIRGVRNFIVPVARGKKMPFEDLGYCTEKAILYATQLGLGTCWLGGTYRKSAFARLAGLKKNEEMPCVVSVGRPVDRSWAVDSLFRSMARSDQRRPWDRLFYDGNLDKPLTPRRAGKFKEVLECVRMAPSASNKQPWRVLRSEGAYHFYLRRTGSRMRIYRNLQNVDMGISICHFDLGAKELGLGGSWVVEEPGADAGGLHYTASFVPIEVEGETTG